MTTIRPQLTRHLLLAVGVPVALGTLQWHVPADAEATTDPILMRSILTVKPFGLASDFPFGGRRLWAESHPFSNCGRSVPTLRMECRVPVLRGEAERFGPRRLFAP